MATTIPLQPIIAVRLKVSIHSSFLDFFHHKHVSTEPALEAWKPRVIETAINDSTVDTRFIRLARIALYAGDGDDYSSQMLIVDHLAPKYASYCDCKT